MNPTPGTDQCVYAEAALRRSFPAPVYDTAAGGGGLGSRSFVRAGKVSLGELVFRSDYVGGGWPQPTTRTQRAELYAALRDAFLREAPPGSGAHAAACAARPPLAALAPAVPPTTAQAQAVMAFFRAGGRAAEMHALRTRSGYTRLDGRGVPVDIAAAHARARGVGAGSVWYSTYPYSTPAQRARDDLVAHDVLVLPQFLPYASRTEGVFMVAQADGAVIWSGDSWPADDGSEVSFGRSRSSPAIDGEDYVYVAADIDDPAFMPGSGRTLPTLFAFDLVDGALMWGTSLGFDTRTQVGTASPIVTDGWNDANTAFMVGDSGLVYLSEGARCPSDDPVFECSRYGACNCSTGACTCPADNRCVGGPKCAPLCGIHARPCVPAVGPPCRCYPCWRGSDCNTPLACDTNERCATGSDACVCSTCWLRDAGGGAAGCTLPLCGAHGVCNASSPAARNATGGCTCSDGWSGARCEVPPAAAPGGGGSSAVGTAVSLSVVLGLPLLAAAYVGLFKFANPQLPWHAALPRAMTSRLGGWAPYAQMGGGGGGGARPGLIAAASSAWRSVSAAAAAAANAAAVRVGAMPPSSAVPAFVRGSSDAAAGRLGLLAAGGSSSPHAKAAGAAASYGGL